MKTASGLGLIALGAILAFAVTAHPSFFNIQVAGWVIMLTGLAGIIVPRRGYGWLRRRLVVRRGPAMTRVEETVPPYVMIAPSSSAMESETTETTTVDGYPPATTEEWVEEVPPPTEETVEEFREE